MASFNHDDLNNLDYRLLQNGSASLFHNQTILRDAVSWLGERGYAVYEADAAATNDTTSLRKALLNQIPAWETDYGTNNPDAFDDALWDLPFGGVTGIAFVIQRFDQFYERYRNEAWSLLDGLEHASRGHLLHGHRLLTLIQSNDPNIELEPVGRAPVAWNPSEWLKKSRGL